MSKLIKIINDMSEEEYFIVEMQGSISHNNENKFYNLNLGRIESVSKVNKRIFIYLIKHQDKFKFIIGNHHILGERENLKNPILVCKKEKNAQNSNVEVKIEKVIKSKIIFKSRPTPVINNITLG